MTRLDVERGVVSEELGSDPKPLVVIYMGL